MTDDPLQRRADGLAARVEALAQALKASGASEEASAELLSRASGRRPAGTPSRGKLGNASRFLAGMRNSAGRKARFPARSVQFWLWTLLVGGHSGALARGRGRLERGPACG